MRLKTVVLRTLLASALATGAAALIDAGPAHARPLPISETCPTCVRNP
ncbi:hypothetical protein ACQP1P_16285 [Dactylosporangium sp. CA-052675]|nr:hypothetical protein GCM10020063_055730 [Dactylosporangium thailandense]